MLGNQLFYSPETRLKVEQELCKLVNEPNPFRNGHKSKWGQHREIPETVGEMMERWNVTLEDNQLVNDLFNYYKAEFLTETHHKNLSQKKVIIDEKIHIPSKCKLGDDELPSMKEIGYKNKGYRWFESGKNFSLKDFITYHPETCDDQVYHRTEFQVYHSFVSIENLAEHAPLNEVNFLYACEGYAAAKYVAFLKNVLSNESEASNLDPLSIVDPALLNRFLEIENKITGDKSKWIGSNVRLAAFCELLYEKKYFTTKPNVNNNRPVKYLNYFAKSRYGIDINTALKAAKREDRKNHKTKKIENKPSLNSYFH